MARAKRLRPVAGTRLRGPGSPEVSITAEGTTTMRTEDWSLTLNREEAQELRRFLNNHHVYLYPAKDWKNCPYESHSDDCNCNGMGGDR